MRDRVYVGVDLAKDFHQVMAVGPDHQILSEAFRIGRGRGGVAEMLALDISENDTEQAVERIADWLHDTGRIHADY